MSSSIPLLPLSAAPSILNAQKMVLPVKAMVRIMCLCACLYLCNCTECKEVEMYECVSLVSDVTDLHVYIFSSSVFFSSIYPPSGLQLCGTLHGLLAWISFSDCKPNNCIHQLWGLHSDSIRCCCFVQGLF